MTTIALSIEVTTVPLSHEAQTQIDAAFDEILGPEDSVCRKSCRDSYVTCVNAGGTDCAAALSTCLDGCTGREHVSAEDKARLMDRLASITL